MSDVKVLVASIINFLKQQLESNILSIDSRESVEVGVQCLESAFDIGPEDSNRAVDLLKLVREQIVKKEIPSQVKAEAERLKNEGNNLMKADKYREALDLYTRAIELDPNNAVYYCNRAASHFKLGEHEAAVRDCTAALVIEPDYSKAHGRLGLALTALEKHREARAAYAQAAQLEPDNESYRTNLRLADERLAQRGDRPGLPLDLGGLLQSPALLNMATEMLADPNMQNLISGLMYNRMSDTNHAGVGGGGGVGGGIGVGGVGVTQESSTIRTGGMGALLEAGQMLAQQMQQANPELVEQLRRELNTRSQSQPSNENPPSTQPE